MLCTLLKCFRIFCYTGWETVSQHNYSSLSRCTWAVLWHLSSSLLTAKCCSKFHIPIVVTISVLYLSCLPSLQHLLWPSFYYLCSGNSDKKASNFHIRLAFTCLITSFAPTFCSSSHYALQLHQCLLYCYLSMVYVYYHCIDYSCYFLYNVIPARL